MFRILISLLLVGVFTPSIAQHSVARQWNEVLLQAIRDDLARPTVHARNLFHVSIALYDAWAAYDNQAQTYFLGKEINGFQCPFDEIPESENIQESREMAMSFAAYRIIAHRYSRSPGIFETFTNIQNLASELGYDVSDTSTVYQSGNPAHLGNYLGAKIIEYGLQDGANELGRYRNLFYIPSNPSLAIKRPGNPDIADLNRWQPLSLDIFIDQSGNERPGNTP